MRSLMKPTLVENGRQALSALEQASAAGDPFPLFILNAHMPDTDGFAWPRGYTRLQVWPEPSS